jgi:hypothetical protein
MRANCIYCGVEYVLGPKRRPYCLSACRRKHEALKKAEAPAPHGGKMRRKKTALPRTCRHCGEDFQSKARNQRFCGGPCRTEYINAQRRVDVTELVLRIPMQAQEETKMRARLKRRILDGVAYADLAGMYSTAWIDEAFRSLTPEERQQREDASDRGMGWGSAPGAVSSGPWTGMALGRSQ